MAKNESRQGDGDSPLRDQLSKKATDFVFVVASAALEGVEYDEGRVRGLAEEKSVLGEIDQILTMLTDLKVLPEEDGGE